MGRSKNKSSIGRTLKVDFLNLSLSKPPVTGKFSILELGNFKTLFRHLAIFEDCKIFSKKEQEYLIQI